MREYIFKMCPESIVTAAVINFLKIVQIGHTLNL